MTTLSSPAERTETTTAGWAHREKDSEPLALSPPTQQPLEVEPYAYRTLFGPIWLGHASDLSQRGAGAWYVRTAG